MLCRVNSGNPAVPVAQRQTNATQRSPLPGDSTEQSLSFGKPSSDREGPASVQQSPLRPKVAQEKKQDTTAVTTSAATPEASGMQQESSGQQTYPSSGSSAATSMQARDRDGARQRQEPGTSSHGQAVSDSSAAVMSSSGQARGQGDNRNNAAEMQLASGFGSSRPAMTTGAQEGAEGPATSSHQKLQLQGGSAAIAEPYSSRDSGNPGVAPLANTETRPGAARENLKRSLEESDTRLVDAGKCGHLMACSGCHVSPYG